MQPVDTLKLKSEVNNPKPTPTMGHGSNCPMAWALSVIQRWHVVLLTQATGAAGAH